MACKRTLRNRSSVFLRHRARVRHKHLKFETLEGRQLLTGAFDLIGLADLRADPDFAGIDGSNVAVAVIDTGIEFSHPLLSGNYITGKDFVFGGAPLPVSDHGTHVAGIVGATDPNVGVAPDVDLIALQVFTPRPGQSPGAQYSDIEEALEWVFANRETHNIVAVNMSLGGGFFTSPAQATSVITDDIRRLEAAGVTVVSAAGNSYGAFYDPGTGQIVNRMFQNSGAPGIQSTLNVGAVYEADEGQRILGAMIDFTSGADRVAGFSQRPPVAAGNAIFAPGAMINSTVLSGRQAEKPGTSMASPMVAGAVALMQEAAFQFGGRYLTPEEVREIMLATGDTINDGDNEHSSAFVDRNGDRQITSDELIAFQPTNQNYKRLNVYEAVKEVKSRLEVAGGPTGDANGTIASAIRAAVFFGPGQKTFIESIGTDGGGIDVGNKDVDMYYLQLNATGAVTIETSSHPTSPDDFDTVIELFGIDGTSFGSHDDIAPGNPFSKFEMTLPSGTYFIGVSGAGNTSYDPTAAGSGGEGDTGNYQLTVTLQNEDPNGLLGNALVKNFRPSPNSPTDLAILDGRIGGDGIQPITGIADVDFYRIFVPAPGQLTFDVDESEIDTRLRLFDAAGNELAGSSGDLVTSVDGGDVIIGVSAQSNDDYDPDSLDTRPAPDATGNYSLSVAYTNGDVDGTFQQSTGRPLPIVNSEGEIGRDGAVNVGNLDVDLFSVMPTADGILEIDVDSYNSTSGTISTPVDTAIYIFADQVTRAGFDGTHHGVVLAGNDDSAGADPLLRFPVQADFTYHVAIVGAGNQSFNPLLLGSGSPGDMGEYVLNARVLPGDSASSLHNDTLFAGVVSDILRDDPATGHIGSDNGFIRGATDVDLYRFIPTHGGMYRIATGAASDYDADTFLRVFNSSGSELASNDNATVGTLLSETQLVLNAGRTYYVGVNGASAGAGNYNPLTGAGTAPGDQGTYRLTAEITQASWQNSDFVVDVNDDHVVTPLDVILVINFLNTNEQPPLPPPLPALPGPFYDVDGNGAIAAADAMAIINHINNDQAVGVGEAEALATGLPFETQPAGLITTEAGNEHRAAVEPLHPTTKLEKQPEIRKKDRSWCRVPESHPTDKISCRADCLTTIDEFFAEYFLGAVHPQPDCERRVVFVYSANGDNPQVLIKPKA